MKKVAIFFGVVLFVVAIIKAGMIIREILDELDNHGGDWKELGESWKKEWTEDEDGNWHRTLESPPACQ